MFPLCISLAFAAQPPGPECRQLARGNGYVVHAVPRGPRAPAVDTSGGPFGVRPFGPRYAIFHTDTKTGRMNRLVEGGEWSVYGPPMGIDRVTHHSLSIGAAAADSDRLYVLVMTSTVGAFAPAVTPVDRARAQVRHVLYVFRLADGSTLQEVSLPEPRERLAAFQYDALTHDLIRVTATSVRVGAAEYRIGERLELVEPKP